MLRALVVCWLPLSAAVAAAPPCGAPRIAEGRAPTAPSERKKPKKGALQEDPDFHACLVRATDHAAERIEGFSRNDYSRRQAFNADSTLFFTNSKDGGWFLYDARTLQLVGPLRGLQGDAEPQWHPTRPEILYYGERNGGLQISALDVRKGTSTVAIDLRGKLPWPGAARAWTKSEGSPSRDGRFWPFQVETDDFRILGFAVWDLERQQLAGTLTTRERPDHVSISPSGRWFVASGDDGVTAYSRDFKTKKLIMKRGEHSDLAVGADGHDLYVSIDYDSDEGWVYFIDLDTGARTDLFRTYFDHAASAMHFSGKAFDRPGWVLVSTYKPGGPRQWYFDKIFALELKASPRVFVFAGHHSAVEGAYFAEPQATVNRDFTRVLFNSNWGQKGSDDVDAYELLLPKGSFP
jgi:WD40 repeat protein